MSTYRANQIDGLEISMTNYVGEILDIKRIVAEFNVYEDLFSNTLKADFLIDDAQGLPEAFPIVGDETIDITFRTSLDSEKIKLKFRIYKMDKRKKLQEREHGYVLYGVSQEAIDNYLTKAHRFFVGKKPHEIVQAVFDEFLAAGGKKVETEETLNLHTFTSAGHHPLEIINWCSSEAQSAEFPDSSYYLFYEDQKGFKFKSLNKLISEDAVDTFWLADQAGGDKMDTDKEGIKQYQVIVGLSMLPSFDIMKGIAGGMLDTTIGYFDTVMKTYKEETFSYIKDFDSLTHIKGSKPILPKDGFFAETKNTGHIRLVHTDHNTDENYRDLDGRITEGNDPHKYHGSKRQKFSHWAVPQLQSLHQYGLNITIPGNSSLKVGDVINVRIPENSPLQSDDAIKYMKWFGQLDPQFLVTAVNHNYKQASGDYFTVVQCVKESFEKEVKK